MLAPPGGAVDGKTLRGSKNAEGKRVHLLSAVDHAAEVTLAQRNVGPKANETGEFKGMLAWTDLAGAVVAFDALPHGQSPSGLPRRCERRALPGDSKAQPEAPVPPAQELALERGRAGPARSRSAGSTQPPAGCPFPARSPPSSSIAAARPKASSSPARPSTPSPRSKPTRPAPPRSPTWFANTGRSRTGHTWSGTLHPPRASPGCALKTHPAP